jgi:gas vesicle protein
MFEEIAELAFGPIGIIAALLIAGTDRGRQLTRKAAKRTIKAGISLKEKSTSVFDVAREGMSDLVEEAKAERHSNNGSKRTSTKKK